MGICHLCPRGCGIDREQKRGYCGEGSRVRLARAALHYWEEPPISGESGSGTVFFSGCPLRCVYCQNSEIASGDVGKEVSVERLADIFCELQAKGALNINLVTATQFVPEVIVALNIARDFLLREMPLVLPIVFNTSGYESVNTIESLNGYVDVFLTDFKYASPQIAARYSNAPDYPTRALKALDAMYALVGPYKVGGDMRFEKFRTDPEEEVLCKGIVVRHLMLPGQLEDSKRVVDVLSERPYAGDLKLSLMSQYTPHGNVSEKYPELATTVDFDEYEELIDYAEEAGFDDCFIQEGEAASESFIPAFDYEGVEASV